MQEELSWNKDLIQRYVGREVPFLLLVFSLSSLDIAECAIAVVGKMNINKAMHI